MTRKKNKTRYDIHGDDKDNYFLNSQKASKHFRCKLKRGISTTKMLNKEVRRAQRKSWRRRTPWKARKPTNLRGNVRIRSWHPRTPLRSCTTRIVPPFPCRCPSFRSASVWRTWKHRRLCNRAPWCPTDTGTRGCLRSQSEKIRPLVILSRGFFMFLAEIPSQIDLRFPWGVFSRKFSTASCAFSAFSL